MGGQQWFYFQISNMVANVKYTFNILNLAKINSQYNYGMQPVVFSVTDYIKNKSGLSIANSDLATDSRDDL